MTPTPDAVTRQWFKEVWDEGDEAAIDRLMAADGTVYGLTGPDGPPSRLAGSRTRWPLVRSLDACRRRRNGDTHLNRKLLMGLKG